MSGLPGNEARLYKRVVVPLDGSEAAEHAVPHGVEIARRTGVPLHLLRVADPAVVVGTAPTMEIEALAREFAAVEAMAGEYLDRVRARLAERGLAVTAEVRRGFTHGQIVVAVRSEDLLVIARHAGGAASNTLGEVAVDVIRQVRVPVLIVPMLGAGVEPG